MSEFKVEVVEVEIREHPNADKLEVAVTPGGVVGIVGKGKHVTGDLMALIPEASIVPDDVATEIGVYGTLAGSQKNRVKPMSLRGVKSECLFYPARPGWKLGDNVAVELGVVKWVPEVPSSLAGEVEPMPEFTYKYEFENWNRVPDIFDAGEHVTVTEKLHGSFTGITVTLDSIRFWSKGLGSQGLVFKMNDRNWASNTYMRVAEETGLYETLLKFAETLEPGTKFQFFGETFGKGVQDLHYGLESKAFRLFDIRQDGEFVSSETMTGFANSLRIPVVPGLYVGDFDPELMWELASGKDTLSGTHMREGVVVKGSGRHPVHGRKIAKFVSEEYRFRKGGTEYN